MSLKQLREKAFRFSVKEETENLFSDIIRINSGKKGKIFIDYFLFYDQSQRKIQPRSSAFHHRNDERT